ncbi:nucleotidyltransferase family protein [Olivibacter sp. SA151]|uniref:nucleotidyltransferase family protein n=1 Tax=Olivibacter jilunii TaxID=985016 RepID=UPI003F1395F0
MKNIQNGIILLAAGSSQRIGRPKQLLSYRGSTLVRRSVQIAEATNPAALVVVLGAAADLVKDEIRGQKINLVYNPDFKNGIASSIRCGVDYLLKHYAAIENIIIMVCDQPYVSKKHINRLMEEQRKTDAKIVASSYADQLGVPALFNKTLFKELTLLTGDIGAKKLIQKHSAEAIAIPLSYGEIDVDTEEAYTRLIASTIEKKQLKQRKNDS